MAAEDTRSPHPRGGLRIGSVLGFEVRIDLSWLVIFFLVFWSLSQAVFPSQVPDASTGAHLAMGLVGTALFFASLLTHELSHAVVSRAKGIPIEGITLFIFGGMAWTSREPDSPKDELVIAGIGPVTSLALAALFYLLTSLSLSMGAGEEVAAVTGYLAFINLALAIFNLLPGFPLDGGRVFRAAVWHATGDRGKATRWAVAGGRLLGTLLMVFGALQALSGAPVGGLWLVFIGWFLRSIAGASLHQQMLQELLGGYTAGDLMTRDPQVVPADLPVQALIDDRFMRLRYGSYPVVDGGGLLGLVTLEDVRRLPADRRSSATVADAMTPLDSCAVIAPSTGVEVALRSMSRPGAGGRALVVDDGRLVGIVSASDVALWVQRLRDLKNLRAERDHRP